MARKSKKVREAAEEQAKRLQEMKELLEQAEQEEKKILEDTEESIQKIAEKNNIFCGVILSQEDLLAVLRLALETKENIKIPFKLYFND